MLEKRTIVSGIAATFCVALSISVVPSAAAHETVRDIDSIPTTVSAESCEFYAQENLPNHDWACVGDTLSILEDAPNGKMPAKVVTVDSEPEYAPRDIIDPYHSNVTEPVIASLNGQYYNVPVNIKTGLHNHSANVNMFYSSDPAVSLTWNLRIRRDNSWAGDDTVYDFEDYGYGSSVPTRSWSGSEPANGLGFDRLPYDGERYFYDAWNLFLKGNGGSIGVAGSVQTDRMTCYITRPCKFS